MMSQHGRGEKWPGAEGRIRGETFAQKRNACQNKQEETYCCSVVALRDSLV